VLGLGPNLFYNSSMEACVVVCRSLKPPERRGRVLFIDAVKEVSRERSLSYLKPEHQQRIAEAYHAFEDINGFSRVAALDDIRANASNLSIPLYVRKSALREENAAYHADELQKALQAWEESSERLNEAMNELLRLLEKENR